MTRQKKDEPLMEAVPFDEFIRRYGHDEQDDADPDEIIALTAKGRRYADDAGATYEEPELPRKVDGPSAGDGAWYLIENLVALDPRAAGLDPLVDDLGPLVAEASAKVRSLVGKDDAPLDVPLSTYPELERAVREMDQRVKAAAHRGVVEQQNQPQPWVLAKDVKAERVEWLWYGRLPRGKFVVLDGDPGQGKSGITIDLAARVSTGAPMPDETQGQRHEPRNVVIISYEDGAADTIRPRLEAAGADLGRVAIFDLNQTPTLDEKGLATIKATFDKLRPALLIIDPLMAGVEDKRDTHNDQQMRRALKGLVALVEKHHVTTLGVRHLTKGAKRNAITGGGGSIAIIGAARTGLLVASDPDATEDPHAHLLAVSKCNYGQKQLTLKYETVSASVKDARGQGIETVKIRWGGTSALSGDAIIAREATRADRRDVVREVTEALRELLKGGPLPAKEVCEKLGREKDDWALKKAKERLRVRAEKEKGKGKGRATRWVWVLPAPTLEEETT